MSECFRILVPAFSGVAQVVLTPSQSFGLLFVFCCAVFGFVHFAHFLITLPWTIWETFFPLHYRLHDLRKIRRDRTKPFWRWAVRKAREERERRFEKRRCARARRVLARRMAFHLSQSEAGKAPARFSSVSAAGAASISPQVAARAFGDTATEQAPVTAPQRPEGN